MNWSDILMVGSLPLIVAATIFFCAALLLTIRACVFVMRSLLDMLRVFSPDTVPILTVSVVAGGIGGFLIWGILMLGHFK